MYVFVKQKLNFPWVNENQIQFIVFVRFYPKLSYNTEVRFMSSNLSTLQVHKQNLVKMNNIYSKYIVFLKIWFL